MAIDRMSLRKILRLFYAPKSKRVSLLREDIRRSLEKEEDLQESNARDFFGPFWSDAKKHAVGEVDLLEQTKLRVKASSQRANLYPLLAKGFLSWWNEKRRWKNEPLELLKDGVRGRYEFEGLGVVRVENLLALQADGDFRRLIYPYFSHVPVLPEEGARLGLWLLGEALPLHSGSDMRVFDVLRSSSFALTDVPLLGNERKLFISKYEALTEEWHKLRLDYE